MSHTPYRLIETAPPAQEPVSLDDLKAHLRLGHAAEDAYLSALIVTARQLCEAATGRALVTRGYSLFMDHWPRTRGQDWWDGAREGVEISAARLALPQPPVAAVEGIYLHDAQGGESAFDAAGYVADAAGARIVLTGASPVPARPVNGIEVRYTSGYGAPQDVPGILCQAVKMLAAYLYAHRGDDTASALRLSGAQALLQPYRVMEMA